MDGCETQKKPKITITFKQRIISYYITLLLMNGLLTAYIYQVR